MIRRFALLLIPLFLFGATPSSAGPIRENVLDSDDLAWFYNKPGATAAEVAADHSNCAGFGRRMFGESYGGEQGGQYGLVGLAMFAIVSAGPKVAFADDCMMSKGYRRFNVAGTNLRDFQERLQAAAADSQELYAGAEHPPEGVQARQWVNDYWLPVAGESQPVPEPRKFTPHTTDVDTYNRWGFPRTLRPLDDDADIAPTAEEAVVFMTLGSPSEVAASVAFDRVDPVTGDAALFRFRGGNRWPRLEAKITAREAAESEVNQFVFVIPAGTYGLESIDTGFRNGTTFCLGTVAFQIAAGEVVDLGHFTFAPGSQIVHAFAPAPLSRMRIDQPALDAGRRGLLGGQGLAERMRPASFVNEFPRVCRLFGRIYGFDIPGAPTWSARGQAEATVPKTGLPVPESQPSIN